MPLDVLERLLSVGLFLDYLIGYKYKNVPKAEIEERGKRGFEITILSHNITKLKNYAFTKLIT